MMSIRPNLFLLLLTLVASPAAGQVSFLQEDFSGPALSNSIWQTYLNDGAASVGTGTLDLSCSYGTFPYIRTVPGLLAVSSDVWFVETRLAFTVPGGCGTKFSARQDPIPNQVVTCGSPPWGAPDVVQVHGNSQYNVLEIRAGSSTINLGAVPPGFHVYRWISNGISIVFSLDGVTMLTAANNGQRPNNVWMGNYCNGSCPNWEYLSIDYLRVGHLDAAVVPAGAGCGGAESPVFVCDPPQIGAPIKFSLTQATPNASGAAYYSTGIPGGVIWLGSGCTLALDLATVAPFAPVVTSPSGAWGLTLFIPWDPNLLGVQAAMQIVLFGTAGPLGFDLSNGLIATVGF